MAEYTTMQVLDQIDLKNLTTLNESRWLKPLQSQRVIPNLSNRVPCLIVIFVSDKKFIQRAMGSFHRRTADCFTAAENTTDLIRVWKRARNLISPPS